MPEALNNLSALQKVVSAQTALTSFNTDVVRSAWEAIEQRRREARRAARRAEPSMSSEPMPDEPLDYSYVAEVWTDHIIVRVEGNETDYLRIPYTVTPPGASSTDVRFGVPERVRKAYIAATAAITSVSDAAQVLELSRRVRTMAGSRRYRKPIGTQLGNGASGGDALATVAKTGSREGSEATSDKLRSSLKEVAQEKSYRGGKVFGDIGSEGKLKTALNQIERLPDDKRGEAAAEVVRAAQALGMTSLVPASIKRLYRQYISQSTVKSPSKAPTVKGKK